MSNQLADRIGQLDDHQVVRFTQHFGEQLFEGMQVSTDDLRAGVPERSEFAAITDLADEQMGQTLKPLAAVECSRAILDAFARDPAIAPALESSLDEYKDDALVAGVILAAGFAVSMVIVAASTSFKGKIGNFDLVKTTASPELVKAASVVGTFIKPS